MAHPVPQLVWELNPPPPRAHEAALGQLKTHVKKNRHHTVDQGKLIQ